MKNILTVFIALSLSLFSSCNKQDEIADKGDTSPKNAIITLDLDYTDPAIIETKSPSDCNVFLYCDRLLFARQLYGSYGSTISDALPQGDYEIYTIVGYGSNLGPKSKAELNALTTSASSQSSIETNEIYTNKTSYTVTTDATINIGVTRMVSKVDFNITVDPAFAQTFTFDYMELINVNNTVGLYSDSKLTSGGVNYTRESISGASVTRSFTMFENMQGTNANITDQRHKISAHAPSDKCTHLHIRGYNNGAKVDYYIYLGANNTSDFNLIRNHHYIINTTIFGVDDIDNRVSVVDARISEFEKAMYELPEPAKATLYLKSMRQNTPIDLTYQIIEGNGLLTVDGTTVQPNTPHRLTSSDINHYFALLFGQQQDGNVKLGITVSDNNGFSMYKEISTIYESTKPLEVVATGDLASEIDKGETISLEISEENYTGDFTIRYDIITGGQEVQHNSVILPSGTSITGKAGRYDFICKSITLGSQKVKFTITDTKGQSMEIIREEIVKSAFPIKFNVLVYNKTVRESSGTAVLKVIPCMKLVMVSDTPLPFNFNFIVLDINAYGKQFNSPVDFERNAAHEIQLISSFWVTMNELIVTSFVAGTNKTSQQESFENIAIDWGSTGGVNDNKIGIAELELKNVSDDYSHDYDNKYSNVITPAWLWCAPKTYHENMDINIIEGQIKGYKIDSDLYKVNFDYTPTLPF